MRNNQDILRQFQESIKRQTEKDMEKGIPKPKSTIRHLEANENGTITRQMTGITAFAHEVT